MISFIIADDSRLGAYKEDLSPTSPQSRERDQERERESPRPTHPGNHHINTDINRHYPHSLQTSPLDQVRLSPLFTTHLSPHSGVYLVPTWSDRRQSSWSAEHLWLQTHWQYILKLSSWNITWKYWAQRALQKVGVVFYHSKLAWNI